MSAEWVRARLDFLGRRFLAVMAMALIAGGWAVALAEQEQASGQANISIRVTDRDREGALEQVRIDLIRVPDEIVETQFTDSTGQVRFSHINLGAYELRASKSGFADTVLSIDLRRGQQTAEFGIQMAALATNQAPHAGNVASVRNLAIPRRAREEFEAGITFLNQKKDARRSLEHFQQAIAAYPGYFEAYFLSGMAELELKQPVEARAALAQAIKLNPRFLEPYYPLATLLIGAKQYGDGERVLRQAQELDPSGWRWPFELARSKALQHHWDQALAYAEKARGLPNAPSKVHLLMADLYSNTGRPSQAIAELEEFEKLDPSSPFIPRVHQVLAGLRKRP